MRKKEIANRRKVVIDTLKLINLYKHEFFDKLGEKGVEDLVNRKLDELIHLDKLQSKLEKDERK